MLLPVGYTVHFSVPPGLKRISVASGKRNPSRDRANTNAAEMHWWIRVLLPQKGIFVGKDQMYTIQACHFGFHSERPYVLASSAALGQKASVWRGVPRKAKILRLATCSANVAATHTSALYAGGDAFKRILKFRLLPKGTLTLVLLPQPTTVAEFHAEQAERAAFNPKQDGEPRGQKRKMTPNQEKKPPKHSSITYTNRR